MALVCNELNHTNDVIIYKTKSTRRLIYYCKKSCLTGNGSWKNYSKEKTAITFGEECIFSFKKMHLKMSSGNWQPSCLGLNVLMYTDGTNYGIPHTKFLWSEFGRYLLVPGLISIAKWSNVGFYNPLSNQLNGKCRSVPSLQRQNWLEWTSPKLLSCKVKSAWQTDGSILRVFLAKSFCIFYRSLRASCRVICKNIYWSAL